MHIILRIFSPGCNEGIFSCKYIVGDDSQFHAGNGYSRIDWTPSMERHLIDLLLKQVHRGNMMSGALDTEVWLDMSLSFMESFGLQTDEESLKDHHKRLGKQYRDMRILIDQRVFSWDETRQMLTARDDVWEAYIKVLALLVCLFLDVKLFLFKVANIW